MHGDELRRVRVLAAGGHRDPGYDLYRITSDELHASGLLHRGEHLRVVDVDRPIEHGTRVVGVMLHLLSLQPDACTRKEIGAVEMIPVDVRDDDVGDVLGPDTERRERGTGTHEPGGLPSVQKLVAVEAG